MIARSILKTAAAAALFAAGVAAAFGDEAKTVVKIGYLPITDHLTIIAKEKFPDPKVDLQPVKFSSWAELSEALKANAVDGAFVLTPIGIALKAKGVPLKAILLGHRNGSAITVKNGDEIKSVADLAGKTIAIPSRFSTHNILLRKELLKNNINPDGGVKIVEMAPPEMVNALATGRIDAFIVAEPFGGQAELQKAGKVLELSKDIWPGHICCVLNVNAAFAEKNREAVTALAASFIKAGAFIGSDARDAAKLGQKFLGQKPEVLEFVLTHPSDRVVYNDLAPKLEDFKATQDYLLQYGIIKEGIDLNAYVDDSFAKAAAGK